MKASYINNLTSSFYLWLDHEILNRGEAYITYSGKLYETEDPNFQLSSSVYGSPFKQWVYDSSITNAYIPSGITSGTQFIQRSQNGLNLDFNNGRIIFSGKQIPNNENFTAKYSFKEFNLYYTDEREDRLMFEKAYSLTPQTTRITGALGYLEVPYPCIFIKLKTNENEPFAFGGLDSSNFWIRCIILAKDSFSLDSVISILADSAKKVFPVFNSEDIPFNYFGDFKNGTSYNYVDMCKSQTQDKLVFIDKVSVTKFSESENLYINKKTIAATVDFELKSIRQPRIS
jgi:hypothetical protein